VKRRVLWIEDEIYRIKDLAEELEEEKITVIIVDTKEKWEEELKKKAGHYDLVILDIALPEIPALEPIEEWSRRGMGLLERIKCQWPEVPIVVLSGMLTPDDIKKLKVNLILKKPILLREFKDAILRQLGHKKEQDL
jgi:DNA-binding response OmpR family regulator